MESSPKYKLDTTDLHKIWKGALIATVGAVLAYVTTVGFPALDKASWGAFLGAVGAVAANALRKYLAENPPFPLPEEDDEPEAPTDS